MKVSARVRVSGPLSGFAAGFAAKLTEQGYTDFSLANQLRLVAHFSRWLERHHVEVQRLTGEQVDRYVAYRRRTRTAFPSRRALAPLLEAGQGGVRPAAALLLAGRLLAASPPPDPAGARAALLECWAGRPAEPEAPACLAALRELPGAAGEAPPPAEVLRRAEGLLERNQTAEVLALLGPVVKLAPPAAAAEPEACRARAALGRALRRDRQNGRAAELLRPGERRVLLPGGLARHHLWLGGPHQEGRHILGHLLFGGMC